MQIKLSENRYGKNAVQLSRIIRHADHHEFRQLTVNTALEGDFETAYTRGDNTKILPTDTQKNTIYALAKAHLAGAMEDFGLALAQHFTSNNPQVQRAEVTLSEHAWTHMVFDGQPHPHAYISNGTEKHTATIVQQGEAITVSSGIKDLLILKTTDSSFEHYIKDPFTTLRETSDRILATQCEATWIYSTPQQDFDTLFQRIRHTLLRTFAYHKSLSVQQTLFDMGKAVLEENPTVQEISLVMPNKHHIPFNLEQFGIENKNEVFVATDEPYGFITGRVVRE
ncbi:factor-independent urate hydroxylase [Chitinophaga japonensis]|uniref:Uricase n=1 Tax=Chitinophaga japonensis TaxID=104662 RepID=A0A562T2Q9_CHIJA|nr:urate oxidase [Chitinophaga japonensis]TWI87919.1 urate oxidase [Chitinophaga japonensis]